MAQSAYHRSPKGTFVWPKLTEPDTKFKEAGEYSVKLRVSMADGEALMKACDKKAAESLAKAIENEDTPAKKKKWETRYLPYEIEEDEDGNQTGNISPPSHLIPDFS